jgi:hypothetical protein
MPLNQKAVKRRCEPSGTTVIDRHYRFALPKEMNWKIGTRVYFSLIKRVAARGKPKGIVVSKMPGPVWKGRLFSGRVRRTGFAPLARRHKLIGWRRPKGPTVP